MAKFSKDVDVLVAKAVEAGWRVEQSAGKHLKAFPPDKDRPFVVVPISLSDWRGLQNLRSKFRQSGLNV